MQLVSLWGQEGEIMKRCHTWICYHKMWWKENSERAVAEDFVLTDLMASIYYMFDSSKENETTVLWASSQSEEPVELHLLSFIG